MKMQKQGLYSGSGAVNKWSDIDWSGTDDDCYRKGKKRDCSIGRRQERPVTTPVSHPQPFSLLNLTAEDLFSRVGEPAFRMSATWKESAGFINVKNPRGLMPSPEQ